MKSDNVVPWNEAARAEWARLEASWTAADPLHVDVADDEPEPEVRGAWLGAVMLLAAFVAGLAIGWVVWHG